MDTTWNEIVVIERRVLTEFINTIHENLSKLAATWTLGHYNVKRIA